MTAFVVTIVLMLAVEVLGKILALVRGWAPARTNGTVAADAVIGIAFIAWGVYLLGAAQ